MYSTKVTHSLAVRETTAWGVGSGDYEDLTTMARVRRGRQRPGRFDAGLDWTGLGGSLGFLAGFLADWLVGRGWVSDL